MSASAATDVAAPPAADAAELAIELRGITKRFGAVVANREIDLAVRRGTIHGIVGENGAGKSTLMSILYGFYQADEGEVLIHGERVDIASSRDAIDAGIGMVHQHFMLVETFSVLENVMLGAEEHALIAPSAADARRELTRLADEYGLGVHVDGLVGELPVGEQQRTEILKALYRHAEILILDEPTGVLTPQEADQLFRVLDALREKGVTIILITHKLREIMDVTDTVSVLRHGRMVAHRETSATSMGELAELMVGRPLESRDFHRDEPLPAPGPDDVGIDVEALRLVDAHGATRLDGVSFRVRRGEILGVAGVAGNGQSALLEVLSGIRPPSGGRFAVNGRVTTVDDPCDPARMRELRVHHVPEDRLKLGLVKAFTAAESSVLGYQRTDAFNLRGLLQLGTIRRACATLMRSFDVRPDNPSLKSASFSGGNQQKLILARELERAPEVLLVGQPTRGVDIGAIELIHEKLVEMRDAGCAVLLVSVELDEIMALSDRIIVMYEGRIVGELDGRSADKTTLGLMMANAHEGADRDAGGARAKGGEDRSGGSDAASTSGDTPGAGPADARHDASLGDTPGDVRTGAPDSGEANRAATMSAHERGRRR